MYVCIIGCVVIDGIGYRFEFEVYVDLFFVFWCFGYVIWMVFKYIIVGCVEGFI